MHKVKRNLKIAQTIRDNVSNSDPEVAIYILRAWQEAGQEPEDLSKLQEISESQEVKAHETISKNLAQLQRKINNKKEPKVIHFKGPKLKINPFRGLHLKSFIFGSVVTLITVVLFNSQLGFQEYFQPGVITEDISEDITDPNVPLSTKFSPWQVSYYCNDNLEGEPCFTETKNQINIDWRGESPAPNVPNGPFSAKFETCLKLNKAQQVYFSLGSDDGYKLYLDGKIIKESWTVQSFEPQIFSHKIPRGKHLLTIEYLQTGGASRIEFNAGTNETNIAEIEVDQSINLTDCSKLR